MSDFNYVIYVIYIYISLYQEAVLEYPNAFITQNLIRIYKHHFALNS
jgi:hypothetical protein